MNERIVRPAGFDSGPRDGPSHRANPGNLSTARNAVSKPAAAMTRAAAGAL